MPPYQVIFVQEILNEILLQIRDDQRDDGLRYRSLSALARTCRVVSDPALDALWYQHSTLEPFIRLLGEACVRQSVTKQSQKLWKTVCIRAPSTSEWSTFLKYSSRVRILEASNGPPDNHQLDRSVFRALLLAKSPLFPNLRRLAWPCHHVPDDIADDPAFLISLITRELQALQVNLRPESPAYPPLLQKLHIDCPHLREVSLQCGDNMESFLALSDYLIGSSPLEKIRLSYPFHALLWDATANLPNLRSLEISLPEDTSGRLLRRQQVIHPFPKLRGLHILSLDVPPLMDFLGCYSYPLVQSLSIYVEDEIMPTGALVSDLITTIHNKFGHPTLREVVIHSDGVYDDDGPYQNTHIISSHTLRPLLTFRNLTQLCLGGRWCMDIDDAFICDISLAWPHMSAMRLFENAIWPMPSKVTLPGLLPLAQRCTKLELCGIALNASGPPASLPSDKVVHEALSVFYFGCSPIDDVRSTVAFLSEVFPNLASLDSWNGSGHLNLKAGSLEYEYRERWRMVERMLTA